MTDTQLKFALVAQSLLYTIGLEPRGRLPREKLNRALKSRITEVRKRDHKRFDMLVDSADSIFRASWAEFPDGLEISIPKFLYFFVVQNEDGFKPFKINKKHLEGLVRASGDTAHGFSSLKAVKSLSEKIKGDKDATTPTNQQR